MGAVVFYEALPHHFAERALNRRAGVDAAGTGLGEHQLFVDHRLQVLPVGGPPFLRTAQPRRQALDKSRELGLLNLHLADPGDDGIVLAAPGQQHS